MDPLDTLAQTAQQVRAAKDGSGTAMEDLFTRYLPQVRGIVAARMGRRHQICYSCHDATVGFVLPHPTRRATPPPMIRQTRPASS